MRVAESPTTAAGLTRDSCGMQLEVYILVLCAVGVTACQYIFLAAFRFVHISRVIGEGPHAAGITVRRHYG